MSRPLLDGTIDGERVQLATAGAWTAAYADALERPVHVVAPRISQARDMNQ